MRLTFLKYVALDAALFADCLRQWNVAGCGWLHHANAAARSQTSTACGTGANSDDGPIPFAA